jgi:hypothetical protein
MVMRPATFSSIDVGEIDEAVGAEEEVVGEVERVAFLLGEVVEAHVFGVVRLFLGGGIDAVEAVEEAAIEEGNLGEMRGEGVGIGEERGVAEEAGDAAVAVALALFLAFAAEAALVHFLIERGEEEVLQDSAVVSARLGRGVLEQPIDDVSAEEVAGDKPLLLQEPAEDEAGEQADEEDGALLLGAHVARIDDAGVGLERPEIPVGDVAVELLVELVGGEALFPRLVESGEVVERVVGLEFVERKLAEDVHMRTERLAIFRSGADVHDERDLFQHVAGGVALARAAMDDAERDGVAVAEQDEGGLWEEAVDLADDAGELGAGVARLRELDGDEEVGVEGVGVVGAAIAEVERALGEGADFVGGDLEKKLGGLPVGEERGLARRAVGSERGEEVLRRGRFDPEAAVAIVAERLEEAESRGVERLRAEGSEGIGDALAKVGVGGGHAVTFPRRDGTRCAGVADRAAS